MESASYLKEKLKTEIQKCGALARPFLFCLKEECALFRLVCFAVSVLALGIILHSMMQDWYHVFPQFFHAVLSKVKFAHSILHY